jgi:hypothetical protein
LYKKEYNNKSKHIQHIKKGTHVMNKDLYSKILFEKNNIKIELCINHMYPNQEFDIYLYTNNEYQCYIDMPISKCIDMLKQFGLTNTNDVNNITKLHYAGSTEDIYACIDLKKVKKCKDRFKDAIINNTTLNLSDTEKHIVNSEYKERYSYDEYLKLSPELQNYYYLCNPYNNIEWHLPEDIKYITDFMNRYKHLITDIEMTANLTSNDLFSRTTLNLETENNNKNIVLKVNEVIPYKTYNTDEVECNIVKFDELNDTFNEFFNGIDSSKYIDVAVSMVDFKSTMDNEYKYASYHHKLNEDIIKKQQVIMDNITSNMATGNDNISISDEDRQILNLKQDLFNTTPKMPNYTQVRSYTDIRSDYTDYTMQNQPKEVKLNDLLELVMHILNTK